MHRLSAIEIENKIKIEIEMTASGHLKMFIETKLINTSMLFIAQAIVDYGEYNCMMGAYKNLLSLSE